MPDEDQDKTRGNRTTHTVEMQPEDFIWHKLFAGDQSTLQRYMSMTLAKPSFFKLLFYELLMTFIAPIPGALGLALRRVLYPCLLGECGRGVVIGKSVTIRHPEHIFLAAGVVIDDYALLDARGGGAKGIKLGNRVIINRGAAVQAKVGSIAIGDNTRIGANSTIVSQGPIEIGNNVSVAGGVTIAGGRYVVKVEGGDQYAKRRQSQGTIRIGNSTRLGMNVIVQDGVTVGTAAIVAPGSIVLDDVGDFEVVSGFPARRWRSRNRPDAGENSPLVSKSGKSTEGLGEDSIDKQDEKIAESIKTWLEETVFVEFGGGGLSVNDSLLDSNVLDSVGFVSLSEWLEDTFSISVSDDEIIPENMDSVTNLVAFVRRKIG